MDEISNAHVMLKSMKRSRYAHYEQGMQHTGLSELPLSAFAQDCETQNAGQDEEANRRPEQIPDENG